MEKTFYIAGVQFHELKNVIKDLKEGDDLQLVLEPQNKYDPNAVRIEYFNEGEETMCGYVPKKFSAEVSGAIAIGKVLECKITQLAPSAKPWEQCQVTVKEV